MVVWGVIGAGHGAAHRKPGGAGAVAQIR